MPLAIEPLHPMYAADRACVNTLEQALDICDALDPGRTRRARRRGRRLSRLVGPEARGADRARGGRERLLAYHVCDWLVPTRDLLNDRGMMGDGVIESAQHPRLGRGAGFAGLRRGRDLLQRLVARPTDEVIETCIARHRTVV